MRRIARTAELDIHAALAELAVLAGGTDQEQRPDRARADQAGEPDDAGDDSDCGRVPDESLSAMRWFFRHDLHAVLRSGMSAEQVTALPARVGVVPAVGRESAGRWENRCAQELSARIETPLVELPGGHDGFATHPDGVAEALGRLLGG
jgi:hypothetical protein